MKTTIAVMLLALASLRADTITNLTALEKTIVTNRVKKVRNEAFFERVLKGESMGTNTTRLRPFTLVTNRVTLRTLTFQWAGKTRTVTEEVKP